DTLSARENCEGFIRKQTGRKVRRGIMEGNRMKKIVLILSFTVLALTVRGQSVVVDTLQGGAYEPSFAYDLGNFAQAAEIAAPFIAQASGNLTTVDLGLNGFHYPGPA